MFSKAVTYVMCEFTEALLHVFSITLILKRSMLITKKPLILQSTYGKKITDLLHCIISNVYQKIKFIFVISNLFRI